MSSGSVRSARGCGRFEFPLLIFPCRKFCDFYVVNFGMIPSNLISLCSVGENLENAAIFVIWTASSFVISVWASHSCVASSPDMRLD